MTNIQIVEGKNIDMSEYGKECSGKVYTIHVRVKNIKDIANKMIVEIQDNSWINKIDDKIDRSSYLDRMEGTVDKIVNGILRKVDLNVTKEFGEYLVSKSAGNALNELHSHTIIPLAELWKEQISGNPGFDFHTETLSELISFGEAKYKTTGNPYKIALKQIVDFIDKKKDGKELVDLKHFVSDNARKNAIEGKKSYVAAFSLNSKKYSEIFEKVLKSEDLEELLIYPEVYLIGVEVGQ